VCSLSALLQLLHASRAVEGLVRLQEYGWSLGDGTHGGPRPCRGQYLHTTAARQRRRWRQWHWHALCRAPPPLSRYRKHRRRFPGHTHAAPAELPGLMSQPLQTARFEEVGRGAPGAHKELQSPCPKLICIAHTVTRVQWCWDCVHHTLALRVREGYLIKYHTTATCVRKKVRC